MPEIPPTFLVTGATGQVGLELVRALTPLGRVVAPTRAELDLSEPSRLRAFVTALRPAVILNAGAYTAVDRAESDRELCHRVNALAPAELAAAAAQVDAVMVHYSTDYVFDGESRRPYREDDATRPLNVYGETKREGELGVLASGAAHLVLRTSWVYGAHGHNFLRTMQRLARERDELRVVDDQVGAPTSSRAIAEATVAMLAPALRDAADREALAAHRGLYHLTAAGATSWHGFASAILEGMARDGGRLARLVAIPTSDYPTPARRPARSLLDNGLIEATFGIRMAEWRTLLARVMADLADA